MKNLHINLIEGTFESEKARKLLLDLLAFKLNYHRSKKLSNEERFGTDHDQSAIRLQQLQAEEAKLQHWFNALQQGQNIHINGTIILEVSE